MARRRDAARMSGSVASPPSPLTSFPPLPPHLDESPPAKRHRHRPSSSIVSELLEPQPSSSNRNSLFDQIPISVDIMDAMTDEKTSQSPPPNDVDMLPIQQPTGQPDQNQPQDQAQQQSREQPRELPKLDSRPAKRRASRKSVSISFSSVRAVSGPARIGDKSTRPREVSGALRPLELRSMRDSKMLPVALGGSHIAEGGYYPPDLLVDRFGFVYDERRAEREAALPVVPSTTTLSEERGSIRTTGSEEDWQLRLSASPDASSELLCQGVVAPEEELENGVENINNEEPMVNLLESNSLPSALDPEVSLVGSRAADFVASPAQASLKASLEASLARRASIEARRKLRWIAFVQDVSSARAGTSTEPEMGLSAGEYTVLNELRYLPDGNDRFKQFKQLVAGGVPVDMRAGVWKVCSGAAYAMEPLKYRTLIQKFGRPSSHTIVANDARRTLKNNVFFAYGNGTIYLADILLAYQGRGKLGYIQGMNLIAGNLLLIVPDPEDVFWLLVVMIERLLPDACFTCEGIAAFRDAKIVTEMIKLELPKLYSHLEKLIDLEQKLEGSVLFDWFGSGFSRCLATEALYRVWDVLFCLPKRTDFLFCVTLSLFKVNEKSLMAIEDPDELYDHLRTKMTSQAVSIDALIKASLAIKPSVVKTAKTNLGACSAADEEQE